MKQTAAIALHLDVDVFSTEMIREVTQHAKATNGRVYCWKTTGAQNWLEARFSQVDVFGYIVLPQGLPDYIEMPNDIDEESEDDDTA